jgi:hypothetical protein
MNDLKVSGDANHRPHGRARADGGEYLLSRRQVVPLGRRNITLPILMYHYIRKPPSMRTDSLGHNLSISPAYFARSLGTPMQATTIVVLDIEIAGAHMPTLARPTPLLFK